MPRHYTENDKQMIDQMISEGIAPTKYEVGEVSKNVQAIQGRVDGVSDEIGALSQSVNAQLEQNTNKVKGIINIAEYGALYGDGLTSDQTVIASAVADAKSKGYALNWGFDNKTYLTTDNIADFHSVKHIGNAIIKRGTDLFYLSPHGKQRNKIYVSTTAASNTFDGISPDKPVREVQTAFNYLENYAPVLTGYWEIVLTAGTFAKRAALKEGLLSENPIEISGVNVGGHPNIPTTIISEGIGVSAVGLRASARSRIKVRNIKFVGFNGSTSSAGALVSDGATIETENVHTDQCFYGISGQAGAVTVPDGIHENNGKTNLGTGTGAAIRSLMGNKHAIGIQNIGSRDATAIFRNNRYGVWAQENSTGHVDWCAFEDNEDGFVGRVSARGNLDGCSFKRNLRGVRLDGNAHAFLSPNVEWGTGANANTYNVARASGAQITGTNIIENVDVSRAITDSTFELTYKNQTINTTSNTVYHTVNLLSPLWRNTPSNIVLGKKIYFRIFGQLNGTNANKVITVRLGTALLGATFAASDTGSFEAHGVIYFTAANQQYMFMSANRHLGTSVKQSRVVGANEMTDNTALTLEARVDNTADNVVIDMIELGWAG